METTRILQTPIGPLGLVADARAVRRIFFAEAGAEIAGCAGEKGFAATAFPAETDTAERLLEQAARELSEYFSGVRRCFEVPIAPAGTPFQQAVWEQLRGIPYGETRTYAQIAARIGRPAACRAVGMANRRNPLPVVVPCHRVVGSGGRLTGYAGGLDRKELLLALERRHSTGDGR